MAKSLSALEKPGYRFAECELDPHERRLLVHAKPVTLTPKVFDTLVLLVERAGHAVSKDELMAALWPRGFVDESNLTKHIWLIRKALGRGEHEAQYIETVAKVGYRFVAPVQVVRNGREAQSTAAAETAHSTATRSTATHASATASTAEPRPSTSVVLPIGGAHDKGATFEPLQPRTSSRHRARILLAAAALAGMLAVVLFWQRGADEADGPLRTAGDSVAIVEFSNLSQNPKDAWLGPALEEMLATEVGVDGKLQVVADELVRQARSGLSAPTAGGYSTQSLATLRKRLNAGFVLSGGYLVAGSADAPQLRLDLSPQSTTDEKLRANFARDGAIAEPPRLVADAGAQLRL